VRPLLSPSLLSGLLASSLALAGCQGEQLGGPRPSPSRDATIGSAKDATVIGGDDSGVAAGDTGVGPFDSGLAPSDSGVNPPADSGVNPPADSGVNPPADSGVNPPADSGVNPPADSGVNPPDDSGVNPPADSGVGAADAGVASDAGAMGGDAGVASDAGTAGGFDPMTRATSLAVAICRNVTRCAPAALSFAGESEADCINRETTTWLALFNSMVPVIAAGNVSFDTSVYDGCVAAYGTADCSLGLDRGSCDFFVGNRGNGDTCGFQQECGGGTYCERASLGSCGVCRPRAAAGASCATARCASGTTCLELQAGPTCVPNTVAEGAACGTVATGLCRGQLECVLDAMGQSASCQRPAGVGQTCNPQNQVSPDCNLLQNASCVGGTCQTASWNGVNGACAAPSFCNNQGLCDAMTNLCTARPGPGQACASGACAPGAFCDAQQTCRSLLAAGAACTAGSQCQRGLDCAGAPGQQICQVLQWPSCGGGNPDAGVPGDAGTPIDAGAGLDAGVGGDAGPAQDAGTTPGAFDPAVQSTELAAAACAYTQRCEPARLAFAAIDVATCTQEQGSALRAQYDAQAAAIAAGRVQFDAARFASCRSALATADCELGLDDGTCDFFVGARTNGQSCQLDDECQTGSWCTALGAAQCGTCAPVAALGQSCANAPCGLGAFCVELGQGSNDFRCVPGTAGVGQTCGTLATGLCRGELQCVPDTFGAGFLCARPAAAGQACDASQTLGADCNILAGQVCLGGLCTTATWNGVGQPCGGNQGCNVNGICQGTSCVARPTAGQPCNNGLCAANAFCDGVSCQAQRATGAACTADTQCAGDLYCLNPAPAGTCGALTWTACP
jgi:hypothetical protein